MENSPTSGFDSVYALLDDAEANTIQLGGWKGRGEEREGVNTSQRDGSTLGTTHTPRPSLTLPAIPYPCAGKEGRKENINQVFGVARYKYSSLYWV